jgi:hypothetical protein
MATYTGTQHSSSRRQLVVVGLAALAVGLVVGLGVSKVDLHRHRSSQTGAVLTVAATGGSISRADAMGGEAEFVRDHPPAQTAGAEASNLPATTSSGTTAGSTPSLYLVGSTAQAHQIQQGIDDADVIRHSLGLVPLAAQVVQLDSGPADATVQAIADLTTVRRTLGLPAIQVVDLRTTPIGADPAAGGQASPLPPTSRTGATQTPHLYLVGSQEQAQAVDEGRFPVDDTVLVVSREASPDDVTLLLTTTNEARRLQGQPPVQLVDLRTPDPATIPQQSPPNCPVPGVGLVNC